MYWTRRGRVQVRIVVVMLIEIIQCSATSSLSKQHRTNTTAAHRVYVAENRARSSQGEVSKNFSSKVI